MAEMNDRIVVTVKLAGPLDIYEWKLEWSDHDDDIVDCEFFETYQQARDAVIIRLSHAGDLSPSICLVRDRYRLELEGQDEVHEDRDHAYVRDGRLQPFDDCKLEAPEVFRNEVLRYHQAEQSPK